MMKKLTPCEELLIKKLRKIFSRPQEVSVVLSCLVSEEEREVILRIIDEGGEEATARNILFAAINIEDARNAGTPLV